MIENCKFSENLHKQDYCGVQNFLKISYEIVAKLCCPELSENLAVHPKSTCPPEKYIKNN